MLMAFFTIASGALLARGAEKQCVMTAGEIASHLPRGRKSLAGYTACCSSHEDRAPSLSLRDTPDGKVLVHCHAGCEQSSVITALRERGLWPEPYKPATPAERRAMVARIARDCKDLESARHWVCGLVPLLEWRLEELPPDTCERRGPTWLLGEIRQSEDGAGLLPLYRYWRSNAPRLTAGLVYAGERSGRRIRRRLAQWILAEARRGL
jgi:hypothetical protein